MSEDIIVKFCAHVGRRNVSLVLQVGMVKSLDVLIFWQISVNISQMVQDIDILTVED